MIISKNELEEKLDDLVIELKETLREYNRYIAEENIGWYIERQAVFNIIDNWKLKIIKEIHNETDA